jgi:hypothetical protein
VSLDDKGINTDEFKGRVVLLLDEVKGLHLVNDCSSSE